MSPFYLHYKLCKHLLSYWKNAKLFTCCLKLQGHIPRVLSNYLCLFQVYKGQKCQFPWACRKVILIRHSFLGTKHVYSAMTICTGCYKQEKCGKVNPWLRCFVVISFIQNVSLNFVIYHTLYIPNEYTQRKGIFL